MTISSPISRVDVFGNGSATSFSFSPATITQASDLMVWMLDLVGNQTLLSQGAGPLNYAVVVPSYPGTGSITYPAGAGGTTLPSGWKLVMKQRAALLQGFQPANQGPYLASSFGNAFDYEMLVSQDLQEQINRTIVAAETDPATPLTLPTAALRANQFLAFNSQGAPIAALASPGTAPVSSAMQPVVAASTTQLALAALTAAPWSGSVARSALSKMDDQLSVKDFGAVGNGVADDTAAILAADTAAAALNMGVYFPPGTYSINNTHVNYNGTNWSGAGQNVSIISAMAQTYANGWAGINLTSKHNWRITNMGFDLSRGTFPAGVGNPGNIMTMFDIVTCNGWTIDHCSFTGILPHTGGIAPNGGSNWAVNFNYFNMPSPTGTAWNQALNVSNSSGVVVNWQFIGNTLIGTGMFSEGAYGMIAFNYCSGVAYGAALACGPDTSCIANKYLFNTCLSGVGQDVNLSYVNGIENWAYNSIIIGNICNNNSGQGIGNGGGQCLIANNICNQNGQTLASNGAGIQMVSIVSPAFSASQCVVSDNICQDFQGSPTQSYGYMEQDNASNITKNTVVDNNFNGNRLGTMLPVGTELAFRGPAITKSLGSFTPGLIGAGTTVGTVIAMVGANVGDPVRVSFSISLANIVMTAFVSSLNNISILFSNVTGAGITLGAGNIYATVEKTAGYASL